MSNDPTTPADQTGPDQTGPDRTDDSCLISDIHAELADAMFHHLHSLAAYDNGTEVANAILTTTRTLQRWYHYLDNPPDFCYFPILTYVQPYYDQSPIGPAVPNLTINT